MPGYDAFSESELSKKLGREGALGYNSEKNYGQFSRHKNGVTAALPPIPGQRRRLALISS